MARNVRYGSGSQDALLLEPAVARGAPLARSTDVVARPGFLVARGYGWLADRACLVDRVEGEAADRGAARDLVQGSFEPGQHHGQSVTHLSGLSHAGRSHW